MKFRRLRDVADIQLGKMLSPKSKTGLEPFPYLRNQNVQWGRFDLSDLASMDFSEADREKFAIQPGDLLICEGGEPGRCAVWDGQVENCFYQKAIHRVRPRNGAADSYFLQFWISYQAAKGAFEDQNAKTTIAHLPLVRLEQLQVPDLAIEAQKAIIPRLKSQLREAEIARAAAMAQLRELRSLSDALYREAYESTTPIAVPPVSQEPPAGWRWRKLSEVARLESGHTPSRLRPDWWGGDISWLSLTEIRALDGKWVDETQLRTNPEGIANSAARVLPRGTVCLSRTASVGFVAIMGKSMATSQDFANWVCGEDLDPDFLMFALIRSRIALRNMATGATHKTIYMPALASFLVCAPGIDEQKRIAARLKSQLAEIESLRAAIGQRVDDVSALPRQILASAFEM